MLLDRASALAEKINNYQTFKNTADETEAVAVRARQFESISSTIRDLCDTMTALKNAGVLVDFEPVGSSTLAEKARVLREGVSTNPGMLNDPPFNLKYDFNDRLNVIAVAGKKAAFAAWKAYVDERAAFGANDVLSALSQVGQFKASVTRIRQIRSEVAAIGADLPNDPRTATADLKNLLILHEEAWEKLEASDIPTTVVSFIRAAAGGEAMLIDFTPEVQSWLRGRNLLGVFRVKLG